MKAFKKYSMIKNDDLKAKKMVIRVFRARDFIYKLL
jgi:hypothetical protein